MDIGAQRDGDALQRLGVADLVEHVNQIVLAGTGRWPFQQSGVLSFFSYSALISYRPSGM
jgi:hypothetical protein